VPYGGDTVHISVSLLLADSGQKFALSQVNPLLVARQLSADLSLSEKGKKTGIIQMSYSHRYPDRAASILNSVANAYVLQNVKMVNGEAEKTLAFLENQLPALKQNLDSSEKALTSYRHEMKTVDLSGEADGS
jgi:tyrosine-protein kinase Etk/Wzc